MRQTYQFSLFGAGSGKGLLFGGGVLAQYLDQTRTFPIPDLQNRAAILRHWLDSIGDTKAKESSLEAKFLGEVLCAVLGYTLFPVHRGTASLFPKPPSKYTGIARTPDAALGAFGAGQFRFSAIVELKTPGTDLDLPQAREGNETPVEQGFAYGRSILGVRWVIVSDMKVIRLYNVLSQSEYEELDLTACVDSGGKATEYFRRLYFLLHSDNLVQKHEDAPVAVLYAKSTEQQIAIRDAFYEVYYSVRADLHEAIREASRVLSTRPSSDELLEATQRLLDRLLFIYYCEDHPERLVPHDTVKKVTDAARMIPGPSPEKVYSSLKHLFREVDTGSPASSGVQVPAYNGELFKDHPIIDHIDLPDSLHDRRYTADDPFGRRRVVKGVWGLHVFDFWSELNEHLLGHIFEESLSDLEQLGRGAQPSLAEKLSERKAHGIYYTTSILSDFLSASAIKSLLDEQAPIAKAESPKKFLAALNARLKFLMELRILDPACGSGAFLVSAYREMLEEYWRIKTLMESLRDRKSVNSLFDAVATHDQALLLRSCLYGMDVLPQAVEIAKLALWLRSARKGEKVANLGGNIVAGDSLDVQAFFDRLQSHPGSFDLVIGNPPWGAQLDDASRESAAHALGVDARDWDSWELFVLLGLRALREGGRLAFVLPDSFLYPAKSRLRALLLEHATIEKVHNLGPDWFGPVVRMGTVVLQARRGTVKENDEALCAVLAGSLRSQVIRGKLPLSQVEAQRSRRIPVMRILRHPHKEVEVYRGLEDDQIMNSMDQNGVSLGSICTWARGEEMNKAGLVWVCPSCLSPTTPGEKLKGGKFRDKACPSCGHNLADSAVQTLNLVHIGRPPGPGYVPFIDGDDVNRRYRRVLSTKWLNVHLSGWSYKGEDIYSPPKILIRQAGVGLVATLDQTTARCPQSVYIYRLNQQAVRSGYSHEFVLGALLSRTMTYYVFKRFSEVDPAKSHAKVTHRRLATLPIPRIDFTDVEQVALHRAITENVEKLLNEEARLGGAEDRQIEISLRRLWRLSPEEGAYINRQFTDLPESQVVRDLFPSGLPRADLLVVD